jgi:hypothetical protein
VARPRTASIVLPTPRSAWTDGTVFGLGDPLDDALILNRTLADWRGPARLAAESGAEVQGPAFIWGADVWASPGMLDGMEAAARGRSEPVRLMRADDGPGATADPLGRLPRRDGKIVFDLWFLPSGVSVTLGDGVPAALEGAAGIDVETKVHEMDVAADSVSSGSGSDTMKLQFAAVAAAPVAHWVELARANLLALGTQALERGPVVGVVALLWAALRAGSVNPFRVASRMTTRGKKCLIHPSAVVEACVLGDNVKVDAGAVLRGCVLGDNVKVGPHAFGEFSILGDGAELQKKAICTVTVVYPGARVGGTTQLSVMGRDVRFKLGAFTTDMNPGGSPVRVLTPDGLAAVDFGYLGSCVGHGAFVGSGIWIAPGRAIEAGRLILRDASQMVMK